MNAWADGARASVNATGTGARQLSSWTAKRIEVAATKRTRGWAGFRWRDLR